MSLFLAELIQERLDLPQLPSAVQFRYAGYKGVLSLDLTDPRLHGNGGIFVALIRGSQIKFDVPGDGRLFFDVIKCAAPAPFNLHRMFIAMVVAIARMNGEEERVLACLRGLYHQRCHNIIKPLLEPQAFRDELEKLPKYFPISKMLTPNLMNDPFLRSMVDAKAVENASTFSQPQNVYIIDSFQEC